MSWRGILLRFVLAMLLIVPVIAVKWCAMPAIESWPKVGQWHELPAANDTSALLALGYVEGSKEAPSYSGVTRPHDGDEVNLYVSGDDAKAYIIDMRGEVLHTWGYPRDQAFPGLGRFVADADEDRLYWRWVLPRPDGSIIAVYEGAGLVALDWHSRPLWTHQGFNHHDLDIAPDGTLYALGRTRRSLAWVRPTPVIDDVIEVLSSDGVLQRQISVLDALRDTPAAALLAKAPADEDLLHTNAVRVFKGASPWPEFHAGRLLISIRELDALVVIDLQTSKAVWSMRGFWSRQHAPEMLANGHALLFDNKGAAPRSRVVEIDRDGTPLWTYDRAPFYSETCGAAQRLDNGNTLIAETETGRAIEVTPAGDIVWEFWNPHRTGTSRTLIAALFEMQRLPRSYMHGH